MIKNVIVVIILFFSVFQAFSQLPSLEWDKTIGGSENDSDLSITSTSDGGVLVVSQSNSGISGNKTENSKGGTDFWVVKLNSQGQKIWDKTIGGSGNEREPNVIANQDGSFIIVGESFSGISGDKTESNKGSSGTSDFWVVKIDANGVLLWDKTLGGSNQEYLPKIIQTSNGGFIIAGESRSGVSGNKTTISKGLSDFWLVKLNAIGQIEWDKTIGGSGYEFDVDISATLDGGFIISGLSNSNISGDKTQNSKGGEDYWIVKFNSNGIKQWDKTIGGANYEYDADIITTQDGGFVICGLSNSNISGDKSENAIGFYDYWVVKLDANGIKQWDKTIGGSDDEYVNEIIGTQDGGFIIAGESYSDLSGDKTENSKGNADCWIVKLDANGIILWDKTLGGSDYEGYTDIICTNDGGFVIALESHSNISGDKSENSKGGADCWIVKFSKQSIDITTGLVAHYKMDGDAQDASGFNNHGTQHGGVNFTTATDRFGVVGKAANFDGVDDYIIINDNNSLDFTTQITISNWVYFNNTINTNPSIKEIISKLGNGSGFRQFCSINNSYSNCPTGSGKFIISSESSAYFASNQCIQEGVWINITTTLSSNTWKIYINGVLDQTYNNSFSIIPNNSSLEIGSYGSRKLLGKLDDIRIYNRALSDVEVAKLYKLESEGIVEIKQTATLKVNPITVPVGNNKFLEGAEFSANSTVTINITRDVPGLPITPIIAIADNQGKFGGVQLPNNDLGASFRVVATDGNGNKGTISYNTSDNLNHAQLTYPFKGSIIQANASGGNTITLKWNDKINLTNSSASGGNSRTVTYVINYKAFNDENWSADIIKTKTLPFGNKVNITDNLTLPGIGTYSIRIKHQNVAELWNVTDNITIQAGDDIQVSYFNKRFVSSNAIKGIVADGVSRMQINCVLPTSSLPIKRVIVTLQDPTSNKTTREILGILEDGRNKTESKVEADAYNPTFNLSTTFNNIQNRAWSMWYFAPTDFSDGSAFLSDKVRNVKLRFEVVYDQNGTEVSEIKNHDIQISRPPLMMLGGIGFPATDTWEKFNSYMTNFGGLYMYPLEQGVVNYNPGGDANGSSSFINNALNILEGNETYGKKSYQTVRKIMTDLGFVCSRVDVLTHGMGSNVVHASMLHNGGSTFFNNSDTYKKGYVNKFISLNAEKNGTPLIDLIDALLKEANKNPISADDLNNAIDFVKDFKIATPSVRKEMKDAIKTGVDIKGKALSYLTTRYLIYYTLANLELPFVGHLVKRVPRAKPQPITIPKRDEFLNELGSIEELNEWFEYLPATFSSISINNLGEKFDELSKLPDLSKLNILTKAKNALLSSADYGGAYLGYYLKSDSLVISDAANELRNNEIDIYNRTLLTPLPLPTSGIHYLVGDLVGGNQENLLSATDWLIEKNEYVERYSKMLDAVSSVFEKIDELSDYKYLVNKTQYQSMRDELKASNGTSKDRKKLYNKWYNANRVPYLDDQSKIEEIQKVLKLLEIPSLVFNYVKTGSEALSFVFNSDGIATTASQAATNTIQGLNASSVTRFPASFNSSDPFEGVIKYNYFSMPSNFNVYSRIRELLNTSINSNLFIKTIAQPFYGPSGFNPFGPSTSSLTKSDSKKDVEIKLNSLNTNALFIKSLVDTSVVKIVKPLANSSLSVGSKMEVQVILKDTTNFSQLELSFQGQKYYQIEKIKNSVFYINIEPSEETELLQVTAKYRLGVDSSLHISDILRITPLNTEAIQKITPLQEIIYVKKGQLFSQSCFLTYQSYETYMTANTRFVFSFTNNSIISFDNTTGFFKALQVGTTEVTGTYKNVNFNFVVIVEDLPLSIVPVTVYNNACLGRNINVSLIKNGFTDANTNYFIELSNGTGSFTNSTILFTGKNVQNQTVTLPSNISEGYNYQIRVRTDIPSYSSTENIIMSLHDGGILKSVKSGYWIDPSTWSCGEVPTLQSNVLIKTPHKIELLPNQTGISKTINSEYGSVLDLNSGSKIEIKNE